MASAVIDRDEELAAIGAFLDGVWSGPRALVFAGEAGIGKTLLWETGVAQAKGRVGRVLSCRGAEAEASLSFAALSEIVGPVFDEVSLSLAAPRRRALAVALLLAEPGEERLNPVFRGPSHSVHGSGSAIIATPRNEPLTCNASEPPIGIEPMTYALREACSRAADALAAPIAPVIALMTPAALGLSGNPVHESVHGPPPPSSPVSPSSPKPAALTGRSPTPSTPGDSGRPSGQPIPGGQACTLVSQRNIRETAIKNAGDNRHRFPS